MEWGWNPATLEAAAAMVAAVGAITVLYFLSKTANESRKAAQAAQASADVVANEAKFRTRPWVGFVSLRYKEGIDQSQGISPDDEIEVRFQNVGALPAESVILRGSFNVAQDSIPEEPIRGLQQTVSFERSFGTVFPAEEPERYVISSGEFFRWRYYSLKVVVDGSLDYKGGTSEYSTNFEATLMFDYRKSTELLWKHSEVT